MEDLRLERRQTRARRRFAAEIADETGELHVISHRRAPDGDLDRKDRAVGAARHPVLRPHLRETAEPQRVYRGLARHRSEEHTSALPSLMRISDAVLCFE